MTRTHIGALAIVVMLIIFSAFLLTPREVKSIETIEPAPQTDLQRRQEVWISALSWCESRGVETAVNKVDRDGTPSYGLMQFKPDTFYSLSKKYGLPSDVSYMDAEQQKEIVRHMINDPEFTDHSLKYQQFPDCIQRFVGLPPRK